METVRDEWLYLGKSSSCHSSFTSMFSIRRVASVVPIPLRGEHGPGGASRRDHDHRRTLTPRTRPKGSTSGPQCRNTCLVSAGISIAARLKSIIPYILGLWNIGDHMDLLSPCLEKHMWGACDQVSSGLLRVKYDLFFQSGLEEAIEDHIRNTPPPLFRFRIRFLHV